MTLEQQRASIAFKHVSEVHNASKDEQKRYATVVYQLISLIRDAGLVQAAEFIAGLSNKQKQVQGAKLVTHLAAQLKRVSNELPQNDDGKARAYLRKVGLQEYMHLSHEAVASLAWYRRFVQSILKIDRADVQGDEE